MQIHMPALMWKAAVTALFALMLFVPAPCQAGFVSTLQLVAAQNEVKAAPAKQDVNTASVAKPHKAQNADKKSGHKATAVSQQNKQQAPRSADMDN